MIDWTKEDGDKAYWDEEIKRRQIKRQAPCATRIHCIGCVLVNDRQCQALRQRAKKGER